MSCKGFQNISDNAGSVEKLKMVAFKIILRISYHCEPHPLLSVKNYDYHVNAHRQGKFSDH